MNERAQEQGRAQAAVSRAELRRAARRAASGRLWWKPGEYRDAPSGRQYVSVSKTIFLADREASAAVLYTPDTAWRAMLSISPADPGDRLNVRSPDAIWLASVIRYERSGGEYLEAIVLETEEIARRHAQHLADGLRSVPAARLSELARGNHLRGAEERLVAVRLRVSADRAHFSVDGAPVAAHLVAQVEDCFTSSGAERSLRVVAPQDWPGETPQERAA